MARTTPTPAAHPPAEVNIPEVVDRLRLVADDGRLGILLALDGQELNVSELAAALGRDRTNMSTQLQLLRVSGLVETRRAGKFIYYSLTDAGRVTVEGVRIVAGADARG